MLVCYTGGWLLGTLCSYRRFTPRGPGARLWFASIRGSGEELAACQRELCVVIRNTYTARTPAPGVAKSSAGPTVGRFLAKFAHIHRCRLFCEGILDSVLPSLGDQQHAQT